MFTGSVTAIFRLKKVFSISMKNKEKKALYGILAVFTSSEVHTCTHIKGFILPEYAFFGHSFHTLPLKNAVLQNTAQAELRFPAPDTSEACPCRRNKAFGRKKTPRRITDGAFLTTGSAACTEAARKALEDSGHTEGADFSPRRG
ncbi:hypothetical protein [Mailhella massiliensis]|uniref:Uncharacterized protein n=1 Tax=Mailhella massiliensis TaxID=1903261 RepID=A0A921AWH0_9BACT|nr:hypothetical protein [Mailhella massiliensis]HJD97102.1 hypothetical protein [Mailhella massiliensis]